MKVTQVKSCLVLHNTRKSNWLNGFIKHEARGTGRQAGKNTAEVTQGSASFTGSVSGGVGVEMETRVGVRVAGLEFTNKLSVTITGW